MNIKIIGGIVFSLFSLSVMANDHSAGKRYMFNLIGAGPMYEGTVPDIDGDMQDDSAICFDVDLINKINNKLIGTATDCLSDITPTGTGLKLVGTSFFHLPQGTIVTRGKTTVQPALHPIVSSSGQTMTHITGAASTGNSIVAGTGRFESATGTARLSGLVDMSGFAGNVGDVIVFDCLFEINMD